MLALLRRLTLPASGVALAVAIAALVIMVVALVQISGEPIDPTKVTYDDLIRADGVVNTAIYVVTPGTPMLLQCVRIGDEPADSPAPGEGLSYCTWRRATDDDIRAEFEKTAPVPKPTPSKDKRLQA